MKTINKKTFLGKLKRKQKRKGGGEKRTAVCMIVVLGLGAVLWSGLTLVRENQEKAQEAKRREIELEIRDRLWNEMAEAAGYLKKLDDSIAQNQEQLEEVNGQLIGRQETLLEVETTQKKLTENAADVSVRVSEMEEQTVTQIMGLQENMQSVRDEILRAMDKMAASLRAMEAGEYDSLQNQEALLAEIERVNGDIREIGKAADLLKGDLYQAHDGLEGLIEALEKRGIKGNEELLTALSVSEAKLQKVILRRFRPPWTGISSCCRLTRKKNLTPCSRRRMKISKQRRKRQIRISMQRRRRPTIVSMSCSPPRRRTSAICRPP